MQINQVDCLMCGNPVTLKHNNFPGYQEPHRFKIFHCSYCDTAFSWPRCTDAKDIYNLIYQKGDAVPGYDRYWKYARDVKATDRPLNYLAEHEDTYWSVCKALSQIPDIDKGKGTILEIGSGMGYLTYSLKEAGYDVQGLDISKTAVELAKANYGNYYISGDLFEYARNNENKYDVVLLTEVIEHIDAPIHFIAAIMRLLKAGGKAIITTPNKSTYPSDIIWETEMPPIHCWWFSEGSLSYIAEQTGAKLEFIDFSEYYHNKYRPVYLNQIRDAACPKSFFNSKGDLLVHHKPKPKLRSFLGGIPLIKKIFHWLKGAKKKDIITFGNRGPFLCAVLDKSRPTPK